MDREATEATARISATGQPMIRDRLRYPWPEPPAADGATEIVAGLQWLRMPLKIDLDHINVYTISDNADGFWIVDTGIGDAAGREFWQRQLQSTLAGQQLRAVLCTHMHADHIGQAGWLCREYAVPLYMSLSEYLSSRLYQNSDGGETELRSHMLNYYRSTDIPEDVFKLLTIPGNRMHSEPLPPVFRRLVEGQTLTIGSRQWRLITGRGHSPEHICLYCESDRLLFAGDQVLPRITSNISVLPMDPEANPLWDWFNSLQLLAQLPDDILVMPAHGLPFYGLSERLVQIRQHHEHRLQDLYDACDDWCSANDLIPALFGRQLDGIGALLGIGECVAHLNYLLAQEKIERRRDAKGCLYYRKIPGLEQSAQTQSPVDL